MNVTVPITLMGGLDLIQWRRGIQVTVPFTENPFWGVARALLCYSVRRFAHRSGTSFSTHILAE